MYGVVTRNEPELDWPSFDRAFYEVKDVTGRAVEPEAEGVNMISCFGDTAAGEAKPDLVPVNEDGERATREQPYFDWGYVCPSRETYREGLMEMIEDAATANPDVRLDDVGFPREGYCRCERCEAAFAASEYGDWETWRTATITAFVEEATDRVPGKVYFTLYPDPYPGHLEARAGLDVDAIAEYVDEFVVPLYDTAYGTTYWLETIAKGFVSRIPDDVDLGIELYAVEVDVDALIHATEVASEYADGVYFGYDASQAQAALRRMKADSRDGESHGEPE
jgi:hypothetical protein